MPRNQLDQDFLEFQEKFTEFTLKTSRTWHLYKAKYAARRKVFSREEMLQALLAASNDEFLRGQNPSQKDYLRPKYILRSDDVIEQWLERPVVPQETILYRGKKMTRSAFENLKQIQNV